MMRFLLAALAAVTCGGAVAAEPSCLVPPNLPAPHIELPGPDQPPRAVPVVSYTLALIWTPQHCFHAVSGAESFECGRDTGSGFVLHGLWPDGEGKIWPQWCSAAAILPHKTIVAHYCATPSVQLMQHEWAKHGTCIAGATPDTYFDQSNRLFYRLRFPDMRKMAGAPVTESQFAQALAAANPGLVEPDSIRLNLDKQGWLQEVWLCLDTAFQSMHCAAPAQPARIVHIRT
jgi:ribonuclease T2